MGCCSSGGSFDSSGYEADKILAKKYNNRALMKPSDDLRIPQDLQRNVPWNEFKAKYCNPYPGVFSPAFGIGVMEGPGGTNEVTADNQEKYNPAEAYGIRRGILWNGQSLTQYGFRKIQDYERQHGIAPTVW
jgi:hypothetical protein